VAFTLVYDFLPVFFKGSGYKTGNVTLTHGKNEVGWVET